MAIQDRYRNSISSPPILPPLARRQPLPLPLGPQSDSRLDRHWVHRMWRSILRWNCSRWNVLLRMSLPNAALTHSPVSWGKPGHREARFEDLPRTQGVRSRRGLRFLDTGLHHGSRNDGYRPKTSDQYQMALRPLGESAAATGRQDLHEVF